MNGAFIPKTIKVGYQNRKDTYSGKLAYVIYYDEKNNLRKENSWESWRDTNISPDEFNNELLEGFVLNKKTGDYSDWFHRQAYIRVFDPRGFEIEITLNNLLYILENCNSVKGKGLEGRFCYGWIGTELFLLPEKSPFYKECCDYTNSIFCKKKIKTSDLKVGMAYLFKGNKKKVYLGYHPYFWQYTSTTQGKIVYLSGNQHYWCDEEDVNMDWNIEYGYMHCQHGNDFNPIDCSEKNYDVSDILKIMEHYTSYTGECYEHITQKEFKQILAKCDNNIETLMDWGYNGVYPVVFDKIDKDTVSFENRYASFNRKMTYLIKELYRTHYLPLRIVECNQGVVVKKLDDMKIN